MDKLNGAYLVNMNTPDFIASKKKTTSAWKSQSALIVTIILIIGLLILTISFKFCKFKTEKFFYFLDFIPITGTFLTIFKHYLI